MIPIGFERLPFNQGLSYLMNFGFSLLPISTAQLMYLIVIQLFFDI